MFNRDQAIENALRELIASATRFARAGVFASTRQRDLRRASRALARAESHDAQREADALVKCKRLDKILRREQGQGRATDLAPLLDAQGQLQQG